MVMDPCGATAARSSRSGHVGQGGGRNRGPGAVFRL